HGITMPSLDNAVRYYLAEKDPAEYQYQMDNFFVLIAAHRLDKLTKGLVIYPKNPSAKRVLYQAMADKRKITKKYLAISQKMEFSPKSTNPQAKFCALEVKKINTKNNYQTLEITLHTGRKHQIRSILSYFGLPIVGDKKYVSNKGVLARELLSRLAERTELPQEASEQEEVKRAYRKLSLKYHPDRQHGKSSEEKKEAEAKMKEINHANDILTGITEVYDDYDDPKSTDFDNSEKLTELKERVKKGIREALARAEFTQTEFENMMRETQQRKPELREIAELYIDFPNKIDGLDNADEILNYYEKFLKMVTACYQDKLNSNLEDLKNNQPKSVFEEYMEENEE
ncbi:6518_t:CDS:2, partial [Cetraspora pellucida]